MTWADWFVLLLLVQYVGVSLLYAWVGDWWRFLYWAGAVALNLAVLRIGR